MDATFHHLDNNNVKQTEASRKRLDVSGRLSPRALFGNLKIKKPFLNEETGKPKDMLSYKTALGWKPPLKVELNDSDSAGPSYHDHSSLMFANSSQNDNNSPLKEEAVNINKPNYFDCNKRFSLKDDGIIKNQGEFTGNLDETVNHKEYTYSRGVLQGEYLDFPKESKGHDLSLDDEISENISENQFPDVSKLHFQFVDENKIDISQSLVEKQSLVEVNDALSMNYSLEFSNNSFKESIDKSIHDSVNVQPQDNCGVLYLDNSSDHKQTKPVKNEEYFEKSVNSPKSTTELIENSKTSLMEQNFMEYKDEIKEEIFKTQSKISYGISQEKNMVDNSFNSSITNSQFLQLESHLEKSSKGIEQIESNRVQLNNSIESIKRCSSSLIVQTDWQNNILRNMIKDIDELNRAVVNASVLMKSGQRGNFSTKQ